MFGVFSKQWKQRGAFLVFTALVLPLVLAFVGLAIDLGNLYTHKSRLQNGADAAALAGGTAYAVNKSKDEADQTADSFVEKNVLSSNKLGIKSLSDTNYQVKQASSGNYYYRVKLTEEVPLYFLRLFLPGRTTQLVSADAVVQVPFAEPSQDTSGYAQDLFIFKNNFKAINSINNPDNFNIDGQLLTTFDGTVAYTDGSGNNANNTSGYLYKDLEYTTQSSNLKYFFTKTARDEGLSVNQAITKGEGYIHEEKYEDYDMTALGTTVKNLLGLPDYVSGIDWGSIDYSNPNVWNEVSGQKAMADAYTNSAAFNGKKNMTSTDLSESVACTAHNGDGNVSVQITSKVIGDTSDPVYVYLDESITQVNFDIKADNERPVVMVYQGTGKLHMNLQSGTTFKGIVYAPNVDNGEGVYINANGATFEGTIIANSITLNQGGTYKYVDYGVNVGGSKSGSSSSSSGRANYGKNSDNKPRLSAPENINWD